MILNKAIIRDSFLITFVVSIVILMSCMLGDSVAMPVQVALGADGKQIHDSQNMTLFATHPCAIFLSIIAVFFVSMLMLGYLCHGETSEEFEERRGEYYKKR